YLQAQEKGGGLGHGVGVEAVLSGRAKIPISSPAVMNCTEPSEPIPCGTRLVNRQGRSWTTGAGRAWRQRLTGRRQLKQECSGLGRLPPSLTGTGSGRCGGTPSARFAEESKSGRSLLELPIIRLRIRCLLLYGLDGAWAIIVRHGNRADIEARSCG